MNSITVKRFGLLQPYFGQLRCIPVVRMTQSSRNAYDLNQDVVENLLAFVKLVSLLRNPSISIYGASTFGGIA